MSLHSAYSRKRLIYGNSGATRRTTLYHSAERYLQELCTDQLVLQGKIRELELREKRILIRGAEVGPVRKKGDPTRRPLRYGSGKCAGALGRANVSSPGRRKRGVLHQAYFPCKNGCRKFANFKRKVHPSIQVGNPNSKRIKVKTKKEKTTNMSLLYVLPCLKIYSKYRSTKLRNSYPTIKNLESFHGTRNPSLCSGFSQEPVKGWRAGEKLQDGQLRRMTAHCGCRRTLRRSRSS